MSTNSNRHTYIILNGKEIQISENLKNIFNFLVEIEKESDAIFGVEKRLEEARLYYADLLGVTAKLSKLLHENDITDWSYDFKKDPAKFTDVLKYQVPIRTQMIHLFTQLEVMYFLHIAYNKEIDSEAELRDVATKDKKFRKAFLQQFLFTENNSYFKLHKKRFSKLSPKKIIRLRNSLVHFFSLSSDSIGILPDSCSSDARHFEQFAATKKLNSFVMLSPSDFHELINSAYFILMNNWSTEAARDNQTFRRKIGFVNNVVSKFGAVTIYYENKF